MRRCRRQRPGTQDPGRAAPHNPAGIHGCCRRRQRCRPAARPFAPSLGFGRVPTRQAVLLDGRVARADGAGRRPTWQRRVATERAPPHLGARTATAAIDAVLARRGSHLLEQPAADAPCRHLGAGRRGVRRERKRERLRLALRLGYFAPLRSRRSRARFPERALPGSRDPIGKLDCKGRGPEDVLSRATAAAPASAAGGEAALQPRSATAALPGVARRERSGGSLPALALVHGRRRRGARAVARSVAAAVLVGARSHPRRRDERRLCLGSGGVCELESELRLPLGLEPRPGRDYVVEDAT